MVALTLNVWDIEEETQNVERPTHNNPLRVNRAKRLLQKTCKEDLSHMSKSGYENELQTVATQTHRPTIAAAPPSTVEWRKPIKSLHHMTRRWWK